MHNAFEALQVRSQVPQFSSLRFVKALVLRIKLSRELALTKHNEINRF
jgi:hypothetical protein